MTQIPLTLEPAKKSAHSYRDDVAAYFKARPNQPVDGLTLARIGGAYAWRSRVSDCRTQLGMAITNRLRKDGRRTVSEYIFEGPSC